MVCRENKDSVVKSTNNTNYAIVGNKVKSAILRKQEQGIYESAWASLSDTQKEVVRKKQAYAKMGSKNAQYTGYNDNYNTLRLMVSSAEITECSLCGSNKYLEVHHLDGDRDNDTLQNLSVICKSCHSCIHENGYSFWEHRKDALSADSKKRLRNRLRATNRNGMCVQEITYFDRTTYAPSIRPKPLAIYTISCAPYNSYLVDNMWVHNCDTTFSFKKGNFSKGNLYPHVNPTKPSSFSATKIIGFSCSLQKFKSSMMSFLVQQEPDSVRKRCIYRL